MAHTKKMQAVAAELDALATKAKGVLSPKTVVGWARANRRSALHRCFEWDNSKAGERYRLWQARELIVSVRVTYPDGRDRQVWVSPIVTRDSGYRKLVVVMGEEALRDQFLAQAVAELRRVCNRYEDLHELAGVRAALMLVEQGSKKVA